MNIYLNDSEGNEKQLKEILKLPKHVQLSLYDQVFQNYTFSKNIDYINIIKKDNKLYVTLSHKDLKKSTTSLYLKSRYSTGFTYEFETKKLNIWRKIHKTNGPVSGEIVLNIFGYLADNRKKFKIDEFDEGLFNIDFDIDILNVNHTSSSIENVNNYFNLVKPQNMWHITDSIYKNIIFGKIKTENDLLEHILRYSYKFKKSFLTSNILYKLNKLYIDHESFKHIKNCFDDAMLFQYFIGLLYERVNYHYNKNIPSFDTCALSLVDYLKDILKLSYYTNYKLTENDMYNLFKRPSKEYATNLLADLITKDNLNKHLYDLLYVSKINKLNLNKSVDLASDLPF